MTTAERHVAICDDFLVHAEDEFSKGDYLQAAEKAWGAVAHLVNSIALENGWEVGSHRRLNANFNRIVGRDPEHARRRSNLFRSVTSLHANFYQEFMHPETVRGGIDDAATLVGELKNLAGRR